MKEDGKQQPQGKTNFDYLSYARDNGMKIISFLGLFLGGLLFLAYYFYIGYLPQISNIADLTYMLFAMAVSGIFLISIFAFAFIMPSFIYNKGIDNDIKIYINSTWFGISIMIFPSTVFIVLLSDLCWNLKLNVLYTFIGLIVLLFVGFYWYVREKWKESPTDRKFELFWVLLIFSIMGYLPVVLIYIIFILSGQSNITTNEDALIAFVIFTLVVLLSNIVSINTYVKERILMQISGAIISIILLMMFFHTYALIPSTVMNTFRLGNFFIVKIHAKQRSCNILNDPHINGLKIKNENNDMCVIEGKICVLSKIGTKMLWKVDLNGTQIIELPLEDFSGMITDPADNSKCVVYQKSNEHNKTEH